MKLYSESYGCFFEFDSYETDGKTTGPKHMSIQQAIYETVKPVIESKVLKADPTHALVQITMTDEKRKRSVVEIGEALINSLSTDIGKNFPVTMAFNRAFDRAALRLMGLYGVYADSEGVVQDASLFSINDVLPELSELKAENKPEDSKPAEKRTAKKAAQEEKPPVKTAVTVETTAPESAEPAPVPSGDTDDPDVVIYPYRKFKGELKTIRYIYENEKESFNWALKKFKNSTALVPRTVYKACQRILAEEEAKKGA